jgi:DNA-binding transcriptional ArsR family regulator
MTTIADDQQRAEHVSEFLRSLAHPLRIRIVSALVRDGELHVSGLAKMFGVPQAVVSQQLRVLRMGRLVESSRRDGFAWYSLSEPRLVDLLGCLEGCESV